MEVNPEVDVAAIKSIDPRKLISVEGWRITVNPFDAIIFLEYLTSIPTRLVASQDIQPASKYLIDRFE